MDTHEIQALLQEHNLSPNAVLGQNFLIDDDIPRELADAARITSEDTVVEVGGGVGAVTRELATRAGRVITVEKDPNLIPILKQAVSQYENVEVITDDILAFEPTKYKIQSTKYKLVGNPPYYLTGRLFRTFLEDAAKRPASITVVIQKEVAEKMIKQPPRMNLFALSVQVFGAPEVVRHIPQRAFWPQPEVQSALLHMNVYEEPKIPEDYIPSLFRLAKGAFSHGRKQLKNTIPRDILTRARIDPARRPQTLTIEEWKNILTV